MRLYLSSFRIGNRPDELRKLLPSSRRMALILNADDYKSPSERRESLEREMDELRSAGLEPRELDLRHYFQRPGDIRAALQSFDAVYVRGGNVFLLRRALFQSGADTAVKALLSADALVYAGYSAGPCVLGPTLRGIEGFEDDPDAVPEGYQQEVIWDGLDVLPYAILPHYDPDRPASIEIVRYYIENHVPFLALQDGEALVVDGAEHRVVR